MSRGPVNHGNDYHDITRKPAMEYSFRRDKTKGVCVKVIGGVICGVGFEGPANQKFCAMHSHTIRYRGKG